MVSFKLKEHRTLWKFKYYYGSYRFYHITRIPLFYVCKCNLINHFIRSCFQLLKNSRFPVSRAMYPVYTKSWIIWCLRRQDILFELTDHISSGIIISTNEHTSVRTRYTNAQVTRCLPNNLCKMSSRWWEHSRSVIVLRYLIVPQFCRFHCGFWVGHFSVTGHVDIFTVFSVTVGHVVWICHCLCPLLSEIVQLKCDFCLVLSNEQLVGSQLL